MTPDQPSPSSDASAGGLDGSLQRALRMVAVAGVCLTLPAGAIWGWRAALGAGLGAAVAVANLFVVARAVGSLLGSGTSQGWAVVGLLKMLALFGGFWWLMQSGVVEALPFVVGYGALPLGITLAQVLTPAVPPATASPAAQASDAGPTGAPTGSNETSS
jgi:hypothetical protein